MPCLKQRSRKGSSDTSTIGARIYFGDPIAFQKSYPVSLGRDSLGIKLIKRNEEKK